jgi:hypothetical protein
VLTPGPPSLTPLPPPAVTPKVMDSAKVLSCPVLDEDGEYFGCLSVNDVLKSLNATLQAKDPEW